MKDIKVSTKNSKDTLLKIKNISKSFGHVQALSKVNFELYPAEVLALVGDNGAGKSTLIKILSGVYNPDHGEIYINGQSVLIKNPSQANKIGIASVYQDLALVDVFNVAENIYLGMEPMWKGLFINYRKMKNDVVWPNINKMLKNYKKFLTFDRKRCKMILMTLIKQE